MFPFQVYFRFMYMVLLFIALKHLILIILTVWKVSKYEVFSGPYFSYSDWLRENTDQEKTPYLDTFHAVPFVSKIHKYLTAFTAFYEYCVYWVLSILEAAFQMCFKKSCSQKFPRLHRKHLCRNLHFIKLQISVTLS